ncbi:hypothetical protein J0J30_23440, partial [Vibrio vulnificus]|nr:hypothetical protein [Vibrio vulnificus]
SGDQRAAIARLKQIRRHASPFGNAHERIAHYFANGLELRLNGGGKPSFAPAAGHTTTAAEILRAYQLYVSVAPFRKMTNTIANRSIANAAE